jgi:FMN phosphatase YigB (HAD superfamily)
VLDLPAEETAFIGCDRRSLEGAAACGLRTIAFNCQEEVEADARLDSFADVVGVVEEWSNHDSLEAR